MHFVQNDVRVSAKRFGANQFFQEDTGRAKQYSRIFTYIAFVQANLTVNSNMELVMNFGGYYTCIEYLIANNGTQIPFSFVRNAICNASGRNPTWLRNNDIAMLSLGICIV